MVTVDTYDGPSGEPRVTHGGTLVSDVPLRDVLMTIRAYAFVASQYEYQYTTVQK